MILLGKARNVWSIRCLTKYDCVWFLSYYCQPTWWKMFNHTNRQYGYCYKKCIVLVRTFQVGSTVLPCKWAVDVHTMLGALSKLIPTNLSHWDFLLLFSYGCTVWMEGTAGMHNKLCFLCYMIDMLWFVLSSNFFWVKRLMLTASLYYLEVRCCFLCQSISATHKKKAMQCKFCSVHEQTNYEYAWKGLLLL